MAPENKKRLLFVLKVLVAAAVIGLLVGSGQLDFGRVVQAFRDGPAWIAMAAGCLFFGICVTALRWQFLLKAQDLYIPYWNALRLTFIGAFFSTFMPGGTGGDIAKAYYVWNTGDKRTAAVTTVLLDRFVGLYTMLAIASALALLQARTLWSIPKAKPLLFCVPAAFSFFTIAIVIGFTPPLRRLLTVERTGMSAHIAQLCNKIYDALMMYRARKATIVGALTISLLSHTALCTTFFALGRVFGEPFIDIFQYFLIVPLGMIANSIPILPMGMGQGETAFSFLCQTLASNPYGAESVVLFRCLFVSWTSIGGLFYMTLKASVFEQNTPSAE